MLVRDKEKIFLGDAVYLRLLVGALREATACCDMLAEALEPFARIADARRKTPRGDSVIVSIDMCRDARAALGIKPSPISTADT
jgi:hypothetical protein